MFYQFDDEMVTIKLDEINENIFSAGYITLDELEKLYEHFNFAKSTVEQCKEDKKYFRSNIEVYDNYSFGTLRISEASNLRAHEDCVAFYIKKNLFIIVDIADKDCSTKDKFQQSLTRFSSVSITAEKLIYAFLESLIYGDAKELEDREFEINKLEEYVLEDKAGKDFNMELLHKKSELLILRNYYEQLIDIGESLVENENEIFDIEDLRYFKIFTGKTNRLKDNVDMLRDSVVHLRDAYQSYLDIKLNQTMKVFTVVTTIFSPLAVIVGWYGMNFDSIGEFHWKYGYLFVICLSISVIGILVSIFKKKKWI